MYRYVLMILHKLLDLKVIPDENLSLGEESETNLNPKLIFTSRLLASSSPPSPWTKINDQFSALFGLYILHFIYNVCRLYYLQEGLPLPLPLLLVQLPQRRGSGGVLPSQDLEIH